MEKQPNANGKTSEATEAPQYAQPVGVNMHGHQVNQYGQLVNEFGQPVNEYGQVLVIGIQPPIVGVVDNNSNIRHDAQGNALCNKCNAPYPLPAGCTSWRCRQCGELNNASVYGDECFCCEIL